MKIKIYSAGQLLDTIEYEEVNLEGKILVIKKELKAVKYKVRAGLRGL